MDRSRPRPKLQFMSPTTALLHLLHQNSMRCRPSAATLSSLKSPHALRLSSHDSIDSLCDPRSPATTQSCTLCLVRSAHNLVEVAPSTMPPRLQSRTYTLPENCILSIIPSHLQSRVRALPTNCIPYSSTSTTRLLPIYHRANILVIQLNLIKFY